MQRIILADIFGYTDALQALADQLPGESLILDPYAGQSMVFREEACAYQCFQTSSSVEDYAQMLSVCLEQVEGYRRCDRVQCGCSGALACIGQRSVDTNRQSCGLLR